MGSGGIIRESVPCEAFQGVTEDLEITTLGRGGSDTSAVAVAVGIGASECEILTDVDGVYTADPEKDPLAKKISRMTAQELASLASCTEMKAGSRSPVDPLAAKIIERSRIPTAIVLGSRIENLKKGALGGHTGTEISSE